MRHKTETVISFLIYAVGLAAMLYSDLFIAKKFDNVFISDWAFIKSAVLIVGTVCLLGYDVLFIRDHTLINRYISRFAVQTLLISAFAILVIQFFKNYSTVKLVLMYLSIVSLAILNYISSSSRALNNLWKAQFSINFWKIILVILLFFNFFDEAIAFYSLALFIALIISLFLKGYLNKEKNLNEASITLKDANRMGLYFLLSNLTLIFAVNGEQFVINLYGDPKTSAYLFVYLSVFTPVALSVNGFLGFYYGPKIRSQKTFSLNHYLRFSRNILIYSVIITILSIVIGYCYMLYFMKTPFFKIDGALVGILSLLCITRGVYISTSIGIGIFGQKKSLKSSAIIFWIITLIYILSLICVLHWFKKEFVPIAIATLSLLNWIGRLLTSNYFTIKELKNIKSV